MKLFKKGKLALLAGAMAMAVSGAFGNFALSVDEVANANEVQDNAIRNLSGEP